MRLIDADIFMDEIKERVDAAVKWKANAVDKETEIRAEQALATFYEVSLTANKMPTIEAEPVRRGHWVGIDDFPYETWECDKCGYIHEELGGWVPNYCPDCGAKMEGEE